MKDMKFNNSEDFQKEVIEKLQKELNSMKLAEIELKRENYEYKKSYEELKKKNKYTERKRMKELEKSVEEERKNLYEIKEYDRIKTEFFSNISHELRTPLNVIFSALQMHEIKLKDYFSFRNNNVFKYTSIMKQNCYRLLRLVNNIIDVTKIDSGYFCMNESNVDIINLVENITLSVADYIESKGLFLIFDTDIEEKVMSCDPEKIERIILNLLSNAIKFTSIGGNIVVNIHDCNENICIKVKDTGRGIPADKIDSIFKRFVQVDKSLTRDCEGSGIGLSLVKCLIELHDGTISVESELNKGTEFIIHIPCRLGEETHKESVCCETIGKDLIERINIEFSDIYKWD
jgi:signal transduction histidine kinase